MTDASVKAGQVWQHKNSGKRATVAIVDGPDVYVDRGDGSRLVFSHNILVEDYILVKDAP